MEEERGEGKRGDEGKGGGEKGEDGKGGGRRPCSHPLPCPWNTESEITSQKLT